MLASRLVKRSTVAHQATRVLSSTTTVSPTLLAQSRKRVDLVNEKASDQLGDIMAKRWLGGAGAAGTDTDRVSYPLTASAEPYKS